MKFIVCNNRNVVVMFHFIYPVPSFFENAPSLKHKHIFIFNPIVLAVVTRDKHLFQSILYRIRSHCIRESNRMGS